MTPVLDSPPPSSASTSLHANPGVIDRYRAWLDVTDATPVITLNEGSTPLVRAPKLAKLIRPKAEVFLKFEGLNPTGSFKDRGMTMAISKAVERGAKATICASTGNTSASAAAYSSRADLVCAVILPKGKIAAGKLAQAIVHGAKVISIDGNFDDALRIVREAGESGKVEIVNSINPDRIEGQKTAAFEVVDSLGQAPDVHILPVGNAGNITAYWRGYTQWFEEGRISARPKMVGFQAAGSAPIFFGAPVEKPETLATAIRIGNPASWQFAQDAVQESGGCIDIVTDDEILAAQSWLAREEGVFVEPASAASIAGLMKCRGNPGQTCERCPLKGQPWGPDGEVTVVCTVTGHGLKDTETALLKAPAPLEAPADTGAIFSLLGI